MVVVRFSPDQNDAFIVHNISVYLFNSLGPTSGWITNGQTNEPRFKNIEA